MCQTKIKHILAERSIVVPFIDRLEELPFNFMTISEKEYRELIEYKEAFLEIYQTDKKTGNAYRELKERREMERFFKKRYGETYRAMLHGYKEQNRNGVLWDTP